MSQESLIFQIYEKYKEGTLTDKDWEKLFEPRHNKKYQIKEHKKVMVKKENKKGKK